MAGTLEKDITTKKEDYSDLLDITDFRGTPFSSMCRKSKQATNTTFDWTVDRYEDPKITGTVDGTDVSEYEDAHQNRAKLRNNIQVFRRTAKVSRGTQNVTNMPGAASPIATAVSKKLVEIKRDMEATFLSSNDAQDDDGTDSYLTCGLGTWISTAGPTLFSVDSNYLPAAAQVVTTATASLDEDTDLQGILTALFDAVGPQEGSHILLCGSVLRRRITSMTRTGQYADTNTAKTVRTLEGSLESKKICNTVTLFEGDFGSIEVIPSSWIGWVAGTGADTDRGYLLDMDKLHLRHHIRPTVDKLPDLGGGPRRLVESWTGLQVDNPVGLGKFQPA